MSLTHAEAVASLHVLTWIARADDHLADEERAAIEHALEAVQLSDVISAKELFEDDFDIADQLACLQSAQAREETFRAAFGLAYADGACSASERERLQELRAHLGVPLEREHELERLFDGVSASSADRPSRFKAVKDASEREEIAQSHTRRCAIQAAILGAFPFPVLSIVTDVAVLSLQIELVRDLAALHGRDLDARSAKEMLRGAGMTGSRIAVCNVAKLVPGWGSLVAATAAFASTYAIGRAFEGHFDSEAAFDGAAMQRAVHQAEAEGKDAFASDKDEIERRAKDARPEIERLVDSVRTGELSQQDLLDGTRV